MKALDVMIFDEIAPNGEGNASISPTRSADGSNSPIISPRSPAELEEKKQEVQKGLRASGNFASGQRARKSPSIGFALCIRLAKYHSRRLTTDSFFVLFLTVDQLDNEMNAFTLWRKNLSILHALSLPTENVFLQTEPVQGTLAWYRWQVAHFMKVQQKICFVFLRR